MATATPPRDYFHINGGSNGVQQPRARKPVNASPLRRAFTDYSPSSPIDRTPSGTPGPPDDAPPSVKVTSEVRRELRRKTRNRMFPTVEYESRVSYFDPRSDYSNFRGFFVLFWIGLGILAFTTMLRSLKETGTLLNIKQWPLFTQNIWELAICDLLMCVTIGIDLPLQLFFKAQRNGPLAWRNTGKYIQIAVQFIWMVLWITWPFARDWTWTAQVYFTLHTLAMFMKMHSYAFYCGHLSTTLWRLQQLDMPLTPATPTAAAVRYPWASSHMPDDGQASDEKDDLRQNISPIAQLRGDLAHELTSPLGNVSYPQNLTASNFLDYILCPTLCYELEYPRLPTRNYGELFYKSLAVFGCIFLLIITSEEFIIPVLNESTIQLQRAPTWIDQALIFAETVSRMLFPFMVTFLLVFLVIFEYILGVFAEITCFADRRFYSDWWNSLDWLEFSREWNIPVHNFFR